MRGMNTRPGTRNSAAGGVREILLYHDTRYTCSRFQGLDIKHTFRYKHRL